MQHIAYDTLTRPLRRVIVVTVIGLAITMFSSCDNSPQEPKKTPDTKPVSWPKKTLELEGSAPRDYYDAKIASSLARLYRRPRVWTEAFHSSGWGRTTDQTLSWLSA